MSFTSASPVIGAIDVDQYEPQLQRKLGRLRELFEGLPPPGEALPELEVHRSEPKNCEENTVQWLGDSGWYMRVPESLTLC
jgi:hypothetical protein